MGKAERGGNPGRKQCPGSTQDGVRLQVMHSLPKGEEKKVRDPEEKIGKGWEASGHEFSHARKVQN